MINSRKLPLYLGLSIFVISILISAVKIGERNSIADIGSRAAVNGPNLSMAVTSEKIVNVVISSPIAVSGMDIAIKYNTSDLRILPSTLKAGSNFSISGGIADNEGNFSFSAIAKNKIRSEGIVASFETAKINRNISSALLEFAEGTGKTAVLGAGGENINFQTRSLNINL